MNTPRSSHAATLLPSGKVLVAGGESDDFTVLASAELYDPATGAWSSTGSLQSPRTHHTMTLLATGKVLVAGGSNSVGYTPSAEIYDPATGQWTTAGAMVDARGGHTATLLPTGNVLVAGGSGPESLKSAELFNPSTGEWTRVAPLSIGRDEHTATLLPSGQVLVLGGRPLTASGEIYDPGTGTWARGAAMLLERELHTATLLASGAILVAGGAGANDEGPSGSVMAEAELSNVGATGWRQTGSLRAPRLLHTATRLDPGGVLVVGGISFGLSNQTAELFDPESETWNDAGCMAEARAAHTATLLPSGAVLVVGGEVSSTRVTTGAEIYGMIVLPAAVSLAPGNGLTFTARGVNGLECVWSFVENGSGATLNTSGDYRAGPRTGVTDVVQVVDEFGSSGRATITVVSQRSAVAASLPQTSAMGCGTTASARQPPPGEALTLVLAWISLEVLRGRVARGSRNKGAAGGD